MYICNKVLLIIYMGIRKNEPTELSTDFVCSHFSRWSWTSDLEVTGSTAESFQRGNKDTLEYIFALCDAKVQPV